MPRPTPAIPYALAPTELDRARIRIELRRRAGLLPVTLPDPLPPRSARS